MALPEFTMRQLLEAGVHYGHQSHRWNPKMAPYLFGVRNKVHVIDLTQTVPLLKEALTVISDVAAKGGRVLFVGTKRQASQSIENYANFCAQYFINHRWLGGTLTNWKTISNTISRLKYLEEFLEGDDLKLTKKELLKLNREKEKLDKAIGGIKDMGGRPDIIFVVDVNKEAIAIKEAKILGIPVVGVIDSNSNPDLIDFPIPGNDDAGRSIDLYCDLVSKAIIDGLNRFEASRGVDLGAKEKVSETFKKSESKAKDKSKAKPKEDKTEAKPKEGKSEAKSKEDKTEAKPENKTKSKAKDKKAEDKAETKSDENAKPKKAPVKKDVAKKSTKKDDVKAEPEKDATKEATPKAKSKAKEETEKAKKEASKESSKGDKAGKADKAEKKTTKKATTKKADDKKTK